MNIVMLTNTYAPHVGGVARSVEAFTKAYRARGCRVLVVAPEFPNMPEGEIDVLRIPAIQNFNGSDFSVVLPISGLLTETLDEFRPDIVHAHHPYLLGMTAVRIARYREVPLVFTHHTLYEQYTHYVPADSPNLKRFVIELATCYANMSDHVFAPSESIEALIRRRGVEAPTSVIPTGVDIGRFASGDRRRLRRDMNIPATAFVVGHLGRLAPEKNLRFLGEAVAEFLRRHREAHFLLAGSGPSEADLKELFEAAGVAERCHGAGVLRGQRLNDAYAAMDVFAFASKSETQGMVLTEAMAAGVPVVALDASGVREVVRDGENGCLLATQSAESFAEALYRLAAMPAAEIRRLRGQALSTAQAFAMPRQAEKAMRCYEKLCAQTMPARAVDDHQWERVLHLLHAEWEIVRSMASAAGAALASGEPLLDART